MLNGDPKLDQLLQTAIQQHHAGRLPQAEAIYREILRQNPRHAEALHLLGLIAQQAGRLEIAIDLIRQAIALRPNYPQASNNLGNVLRSLGRLDEAIATFRQAIAFNPQFPQLHLDLGNALYEHRQLDQAIAAYRQAIALQPNLPDAHNNLGVALNDKGQFDDAIAVCRQAIAGAPDYPEAHYNLGNALRNKGQLDGAIAAYRQAIAYRPNFAEAHNNLGNALYDRGQADAAIAAFRQAVKVKPDYADAHCNIGNALRGTGQLTAAIAAYSQSISLRADDPEVYSNLSNALNDQGRVDEAVAACRQAIALKRDCSEAHVNLGNALKEKGQLDDAVTAYRQAVAFKPDNAGAHSNLIYAMHFHAGYDARAIAEELRRWGHQHAQPLRKFIQPHSNDRNPQRRLRIGYVSPDFRDHAVGRFLLPLLAHHDKGQVEVFAYANQVVFDEMTRRLRSHVDVWRNILGLSDSQAADLVRQDQIDILVDLTIHTAHNRLLVFAHKPAPVQVSYLAYCSSTGLQTIDYRLSDPYLDPPGTDESIYNERTIRLPETYWCYQPTAGTPEIGPLPALSPGNRDWNLSPPPGTPGEGGGEGLLWDHAKGPHPNPLQEYQERGPEGAEIRGRLPALARGFITFGCLNNFCKVSGSVLAAWARLLQATEDSQLLLHAHPGNHRQRVQERLQKEGIDPRRLRFVGKLPLMDYFRLYNQIDIGLDTFPYGGATTTCDALWMGVPVVSLSGNTAVGRAGLSILSNVGLRELVARTEQDYVRIASELASDPPRLANLRSTLRERMEQSPLMDAPRFARNIESAYRSMWREWCGSPVG